MKEMPEDFKGKVVNCHLHFGEATPDDEPLFVWRKDGTIVPNLDGFVILPMAEYERLKDGNSGR